MWRLDNKAWGEACRAGSPDPAGRAPSPRKRRGRETPPYNRALLRLFFLGLGFLFRAAEKFLQPFTRVLNGVARGSADAPDLSRSLRRGADDTRQHLTHHRDRQLAAGEAAFLHTEIGELHGRKRQGKRGRA